MEALLLKSVTVLHPNSSFNGKVADILISDGKIAEIGADLSNTLDAEEIDCTGKYISPGFFDLNVNFCEPGLETKEDIESGTKAAAAGGFTGIAMMPNTNPPVHSKAEVAYIINKTSGNLVSVFPLGSISYKREGKDLAELFDMNLSGAIAFTDGNIPVADSGLMSRALLYSKGFNGLIFSYAEDPQIAGNGNMNEGKASTYLGMKGIPALAEEIMVARDIALAEYNGSRIHFSTISTSGAVNLIRAAKKKGLQVSCDVAAHHLVFTEDSLNSFDSNFKVKPPLRTQADIKALIDGLNDGTIDAIVSQHTPHEIEFKDVEFEIASYGIIGLQTVLPLLIQAGLSPEIISEKLSISPRRILGLPIPVFEAGALADLVVFDTETSWELNLKTSFSKSKNTPLFNQMLKGRVLLVCNNTNSQRF